MTAAPLRALDPPAAPLRVLEPPSAPLSLPDEPAAPLRAAGAPLLGRAAALFVTPRPRAAAEDPVAAIARIAPRAAVLGSPEHAPPVAAALANALRRRERMPAALVIAWPSEPARPHAATPAARRLAARLAARGLPATPCGRLAWVTLDGEPAEAAAGARRLAGIVETPVVTTIAGPRSEPIDELLDEQDLVAVVTAEPDGPLARLAITSLTVPAYAVPPLTGAGRRLALAGVGTARAASAERAEA